MTTAPRSATLLATLLLLSGAVHDGLGQAALPVVQDGMAVPPAPAPSPLQLRPDSTPAAAAFPLVPEYGAWVGITKWATLGASAGFGALGFVLHEDANSTFDRLNRRCRRDPDTCRSRNPDGSYTDPLLESLYQQVLTRDRQARWSLIGAEISFGVSVVLFILDFQRKRRPSDIPYDPDEGKSRLRLSATPGQLALRYYFK